MSLFGRKKETKPVKTEQKTAEKPKPPNDGAPSVEDFDRAFDCAERLHAHRSSRDLGLGHQFDVSVPPFHMSRSSGGYTRIETTRIASLMLDLDFLRMVDTGFPEGGSYVTIWRDGVWVRRGPWEQPFKDLLQMLATRQARLLQESDASHAEWFRHFHMPEPKP